MVISMLAVMVANAQIMKINKDHLDSDSSGYFTGVVDGAFSVNNRSSTVQRQNVYVGIRTNLDLVHIGEEAATLFLGGMTYFKLGEGPLISHGSMHVRHIFMRKALVTPEAFMQIQYDDSRNMTSRELLGGGLRVNLIRSNQNHMSAGLGAFYEDERWRGETEISKSLMKMNSYLSGTVSVGPKVILNTIVYYQTGFDKEIEAYRHRFNGHLEVKNEINSHLKLKYSVDMLIDNRPIIPLNKVVYETFLGLEYHFK